MEALELEILTTMQFDFSFDFPFDYAKKYYERAGIDTQAIIEKTFELCLASYFLHPYCLFYPPRLVAMAAITLVTSDGADLEQTAKIVSEKATIISAADQIDARDVLMLAEDLQARRN